MSIEYVFEYDGLKHTYFYDLTNEELDRLNKLFNDWLKEYEGSFAKNQDLFEYFYYNNLNEIQEMFYDNAYFNFMLEMKYGSCR